MDSIAKELKPLLSCHVHQLYLTLRPASESLSWNLKPSVWSRFFEICFNCMDRFKQLCCRLEDICRNRLDCVLHSVYSFSTCPSARDKIWTPEELIQVIRDSCRKAVLVRFFVLLSNVVVNGAIIQHHLMTQCRRSSKRTGCWRPE